MATISIHNGSITLSNNTNEHRWLIKPGQMRDFDWYLQTENYTNGEELHRKCLATYLTPANCRKVARHCRLFDINESGTLFPRIKGFVMGNPDNKWCVVKIDQRSLKRMISINLLNNRLFKLYFRKLNKK